MHFWHIYQERKPLRMPKRAARAPPIQQVEQHSLYFQHDIDRMDCTSLELRAGDRIYIPMGVYHGAVTGPVGSTHLDFGFMRAGITWADLIVSMARVTGLDGVRPYTFIILAMGLSGAPGILITKTFSPAPNSFVERPQMFSICPADGHSFCFLCLCDGLENTGFDCPYRSVRHWPRYRHPGVA